MLLNIKQAAEKLGVSEYRLRQLLIDGTIPSISGTGSKKFYRIDEGAINAYKRSLRQAGFTAPAHVVNAVSTQSVAIPQPPHGFIDLKAAAGITGLAETSLYRYIDKGDVERVKVQGRTFVREEQVRAIKTRAAKHEATPPQDTTIQKLEPVPGMLRIQGIEELRKSLEDFRARLPRLVEEAVARAIQQMLGGPSGS